MSQPVFLAMDTATEACSVAIHGMDGIFEECVIAANVHSQALLPMIERVLQRSGYVLSDLTAIACGVGPGGFTGVRIGVSTAQALALIHQLPVYPVSSLQALAAGVPHPQVLVALDARKGEVYAGSYVQNDAGLPQLQGVERVCAPEAVDWPEEGFWWGLGTGWQAYHQHWQGSQILGWSGDCFPQAKAVLRLAMARHAAGDPGIHPTQLEPHYIRPFLPQEQQK
ncbi:MAG: tRNA (adenosine(37)-N6)-threonylcarbamoyltransferase complex dimerization subunit type 1 TsaB [Acidithiobacillus sp.]